MALRSLGPGVESPLGALTEALHSSKLTWKWRGAPYKTTILYIGPLISFHVNLGEGIYLLYDLKLPRDRPYTALL